jgi:hypothetical protein
MGDDGHNMGGRNRFVLGALIAGAVVALVAGCNDEKKPPLTPDGPEMTTPVGGDAGPDMPPAPAPTTTTPVK